MQILAIRYIKGSGGATPGRARSNDPAGRSTALAQALASPCLTLGIALLR